MDNEQENEKHENSKPSKEDIPAWLQGLENMDPENENPENLMDDVADSWVREVADKPDHEQIQDSLETSDEDVEEVKPDWLNQLSKIDSGTPAILRKDIEEPTIEEPMGIEATKKTEINEDLIENHDFENTSTDNSSPDSNDFNGDMSAEEAYIELSEFDLEENRENMQPTLDEPLQDEEELPDWLQEMITEPSEPGSEISQPHLEGRIEEDEEYIDQMDITQETDISEFAEGTEVSEVEETAEIGDVEEMAEIDDSDLSPTSEMINFVDSAEGEINSTFNEENIYSPWEDNSQSAKNDEFEFEKSPDSENSDLPKTLMFGKYLLDQKDVDPAIEIFSTYISQSKHLDEIQVWLSEATENEIESKSSVWELIGDIALIKAEPDKALTAYSQAINSLLHAKELTNEAD